MSLRKAMWRGGLFGSQFYPNGNGPWRGGLWASQRAGGGGTDWSSVVIGDEVEGGIYAGEIEYADGRRFHIVFAKQSGELAPSGGDTRWQTMSNSFPGAEDVDDGVANTDAIVASTAGIDSYPAAKHCVDYQGGGFDDWYLPATNELLMGENLVAISHSEIADPSEIRWTSRETTSGNAVIVRLSDGFNSPVPKDTTTYSVRPIRRVAVAA